MKHVTYHYDKYFELGEIDPNVYSSFIEHLGRSVYTGIYQPGHFAADEAGFRNDVMDLVKELNISLVRYPGGNFVSNYDWKDGIGPKEKRPQRMEFAWSSIETNQFGIDDFYRWAIKTGVEPMIAVNLGTGTAKSAGELVEYCNHEKGTYWSDLRRKNGSQNPYKIKYWCLGNEMECSWQAGHLSAEDYAKKACEAAKLMKWVDPEIKLIACGSSYEMMTQYLEWDRVVLKALYPYVDYVSTHNYNMNAGQGTSNFLASYKQLDEHIKNTEKAIDYVEAKEKEKGKIKICLDEWNVWNFQDIKVDNIEDLLGKTSFEITSAKKWEIAPGILEEKYDLLDALTVGGLAITILKHCDRVKIACLAQLVNVIAPITTQKDGGVLKQTTYYPFQMISKYGRGTVLQPVIEGDTYLCDFGELPLVEAAAVYNKETNQIRIFALNCSQAEDTVFSLTVTGFGQCKLIKHFVLKGDDLKIRNTFEKPDNVIIEEMHISDTKETVQLPKMSWNVLILEAE